MHIGKKGFTLVEVVVSLAIMTIVAGAIGAFMVAGNNSYMRGNKELTLQEEAQLAANQIIDMIIDVEKDIQFTDNGTTSELFLENEKNSYLLQWRAGSGVSDPGKVYFFESDNTLDADGNLNWSSESLLAEYVTKFDVDLSGVRKDRTVILRMDFAYQDKSYSINETIRLRNDLSAAKGTDYVWISGLQVSPKNPSLKQSDSLNFSYRVLGDPEAAAEEMAKPDPVTWKVEYYNGGGTPTPCKSSIDAKTGRLTIAADEILGDNILLVTCTLNSNPSLQDTALVNVLERKVLGLTITPNYADIERGSSDTFTYTLTGTQNGMDAGVEWKVERVNGATLASGTQITSTGDGTPTSDGSGHLVKNGTASLAVDTTEKTGTYVLRVTCTSNADSDYKDTALVTVSVIKGQYTVELIPGVLTEYEFTESGETRMGYKVNIECLPSWADYANGYPIITWEVVDDASGYTLEPYEEDESNIYKQTLKCSTNINTTVTVRAKVQLDAENWYYPTLDIQIPDLQAAKVGGAPYISSNQFVLYRNGYIECSLENYKLPGKITWRIANDVELGLAPSKEEEDNTAGLDETNYNNLVRVRRQVGFSKGLDREEKGNFNTNYDGKNGSKNLYPTLTRESYKESVFIWAKCDLAWNKEYRLRLEAVDEQGNVIANTDVLIPECKVFFPSGMRFMTINQGQPIYPQCKCQKKPHNHWGDETNPGLYNQWLYADLYGFYIGNVGLSTSGKWLDLNAKMVAENELVGNTGVKVVTHTEDQWAIQISIDTNEQNDIIYFRFYDGNHYNDENYRLDRMLVLFWNRKDAK